MWCLCWPLLPSQERKWDHSFNLALLQMLLKANSCKELLQGTGSWQKKFHHGLNGKKDLGFKIGHFNCGFSFLSYTNIQACSVPYCMQRRERVYLMTTRGSSTGVVYYRVSEGLSSDSHEKEDLNPSPPTQPRVLKTK